MLCRNTTAAKEVANEITKDTGGEVNIIWTKLFIHLGYEILGIWREKEYHIKFAFIIGTCL